MRGFKDIGSNGHFSAKKGFFGYKNPLGGSKIFFDPIFFYWSSKWYGDLTSCKKSDHRGGFDNLRVKMPPMWSQKLVWVKITSKMKSAPSNYSDCKFSAKSNNF